MALTCVKEVCEKNLRNSVERIQRICETKVSVGFFDVYYSFHIAERIYTCKLLCIV